MPEFVYQGHRLFYREQGQGVPLLILHGNTASSALHAGELAYFSQRCRVIALDALGCGQSDRVAVWPMDWWRQYGAQAQALIEYIGAPRWMVMGTSGGAIAALWLAAQAPDGLQAVIVDSCVRRQPPDNIRHMVTVGRADRTPGQIDFWRTAHGADWEQVIAADNQLMLALADSGGDMLAGCPLDHIVCPALFTASRQDDLLPQVIQQQAEMVQQVDSASAYLHHAGQHPLMWSQPHVFRSVVDVFLASL